MKLKILSLVAFLLVMCSAAKAQKLSAQNRVKKTIDTTTRYNWFKENVRKLRLEDLMQSSDSLHFRFWRQNQVIEIRVDEQNTFRGNLVSYTSKYDPNAYLNPGRKEKIFTKKVAIDTVVAKRIYERAMDITLFDIPAQNKISGWKQGADGYSVSVELSSSLKYSMKHYWSPSFQVAVPEAKLISEFEAFLESTLGMREKWTAFVDGLPKGCYHTGGLAIVCNSSNASRRMRKAN